MNRELIYSGRDNTIDLVLTADKVPVDLAAVTRVTVAVGATTVDSALNPSAFQWPVSRTLNGKPVTAMLLKFGAVGLTAGDYRGRLTVYDIDHPNGLVWTETLPLTVV